MKSKYILQYLCFRAFPMIALMIIVFVSLLLVPATIENKTLKIILLVFAIIAICAAIGCFLFNVIRFSRMINLQKQIYGVDFYNENAVTLSVFTVWIVLSNEWLILPGKLAVLRQSIKDISVNEIIRGKGGNIYKVQLKTDFGKYIMKINSRDKAKIIKNWANKYQK